MPQRKQPLDLSTLSIVSLTSFFHELVRRRQECDLHPLHDFLFGGLPAPLCDRLSQALLKLAEDLELSNDLRRVVLHPRVSALETRRLQLLSEMPHLQVLKLARNYLEQPNDIFLLQGISQMTGLKYFCMDGDCSDTIVAALALHCPRLESLIILFSPDVTDQSVNNICSFQHLKTLGLQEVDISAEGFNRFHSGIQTPFFSLERLELSFIVSCDFNLSGLVEIWPNLTKVGLDYASDLSALATLKHLREVKLRTFHFTAHNMVGLLRERGKSLTSVHLSYVKDVDLALLCEMCPSVRNLVLTNCRLLDLQHSTLQLVPPLTALEQLSFLGSVNVRHLTVLLRRCDLLKTFDMCHVRREFVLLLENLLTRHCLKELEHFSLGFNSCVTMRTVLLMVDCCPRLKTITGLEACNAISNRDIGSFKDEMTNSNFELTLDRLPPKFIKTNIPF